MAMSETGRRLLWFAGLWLGGVAALAVIAYALRTIISL
jgi:hypothetical protein